MLDKPLIILRERVDTDVMLVIGQSIDESQKTSSRCDGVQWLRDKLKKDLKEAQRSLTLTKNLRNQVEAGTLELSTKD